MSVRFYVLGGSGKGVEMGNSTASTILSLLGQNGRRYLEGQLPVSRFSELLAGITPEAVKRAQVPPRSPYDATDAPSPREWLESRIAGLQALVGEAERSGKTEIIWR